MRNYANNCETFDHLSTVFSRELAPVFHRSPNHSSSEDVNEFVLGESTLTMPPTSTLSQRQQASSGTPPSPPPSHAIGRVAPIGLDTRRHSPAPHLRATHLRRYSAGHLIPVSQLERAAVAWKKRLAMPSISHTR